MFTKLRKMYTFVRSVCSIDTYHTQDEDHLGCTAYPNCEDWPNGCSVEMGADMEWAGHRD